MDISISLCSASDFLALLPYTASESIRNTSEPFIQSDIRAIPGSFDRQVLVASADSIIVGYLFFYYMPDPKFCHFSGIFVDEDYRLRGIATYLMEELANCCEVNKWRRIKLHINPPTKEKDGLWRSLRRIVARHPYRIQLD